MNEKGHLIFANERSLNLSLWGVGKLKGSLNSRLLNSARHPDTTDVHSLSTSWQSVITEA